jgi:F0F1-type ATP synthase membrane subunit b/b'
MFLQLGGTFWVQIVNFVVFYLVLDLVFLRSVRRAISARRKFIDSIYGDYERARHEMAELKARGEMEQLASRRAIEEHFARMRAEAGEEAALISARASALAHDRTSKAQTMVAQEVEAASQRLEALADELGGVLFGRLLEPT